MSRAPSTIDDDNVKEVENTIPVLPAKNVAASMAFYVARLGFVVDWGESEDAQICQVSRDGHPIALSQDDAIGSPGCVWIGLETDRVFREFKESGVTVLSEPQNKPWAYEMFIQDLDGNILLGTGPKAPKDQVI